MLIKALVDLASAALPAVNVVDGWKPSTEYGDFLMIGATDPFSTQPFTAAESSQEPGPMGTNRARNESGSVFCVALSGNSDDDIEAARETAFDITAQVESLIRSAPSLGIAAGGLFVADFGGVTGLEQTRSDGAEALVQFSVAFRARL